MASNRRRFAGILLAGQPLEDVGVQLAEAQGRLSKIRQDQSEQRIPSVDKKLSVSGFYQSDPVQGPMEKPQLGNRETFQMLADNPPPAEYTLTWDVDGSYDGGSNLKPGDRIKIGRAVQKEWNNVIKELPEGSLVTNSPVGASSGDFSRADAYMSSGFGPVQNDGTQYGLVRGGQIVPISPFMPSAEHAIHLARKARMGGQVDVSDAVLSALKDPRRKQLESWTACWAENRR